MNMFIYIINQIGGFVNLIFFGAIYVLFYLGILL